MKITYPELIAIISDATGMSDSKIEEFLKFLFPTISSTLETGEAVKVPSLGTFKVITIEERKSVNVNTGEQVVIPEHLRVSFVPAKEIAERINEPFSAFEAVELADDLTEADLEKGEDEILPPPIPAAIEHLSPQTIQETSESESISQDIEEHEEETNIEDDNEVSTPIDTSTDQEPVSDIEEENVTGIDYPQEQEEYEASVHHRFGWGIAIGVIVGLLLGAVMIYSDYALNQSKILVKLINQKDALHLLSEEDSDAEIMEKDISALAINDTIDSLATNTTEKSAVSAPAPKEVYDTISSTRYLTTMAQQYYGNYNLWPYIYMENQEFLKNPDRIKPGTEVRIPPLEKYGVDPKNPEDIEKAKQEGAKIYQRYK